MINDKTFLAGDTHVPAVKTPFTERTILLAGKPGEFGPKVKCTCPNSIQTRYNANGVLVFIEHCNVPYLHNTDVLSRDPRCPNSGQPARYLK